MFVIFSVFYILVAAAMIVLILLQNGAGAEAGSGFGGGASATVFGARGSATFLTRATGVLAAVFFLLSIAMGIYLHAKGGVQTSNAGLGVMSGLPTPAAQKTAPAGTEVPTASPAAQGSATPAAKPSAAPASSKTAGEIPSPPKSN